MLSALTAVMASRREQVESGVAPALTSLQLAADGDALSSAATVTVYTGMGLTEMLPLVTGGTEALVWSVAVTVKVPVLPMGMVWLAGWTVMATARGGGVLEEECPPQPLSAAIARADARVRPRMLFLGLSKELATKQKDFKDNNLQMGMTAHL